MVPFRCWAGALILLLTGCAGGGNGAALARIQADLGRYDRSVFSQDGLGARYSGATSLDFTRQHGTQVEFMSSDGRAYLWYRGNADVVTGEWEVRAEPGQRMGGRICFRYGPATLNPVTRQRGGEWSCARAADFIAGEEEYTRGDPFGLAVGGIPFVMQPGKHSFKTLGQRIGITIVPFL